MDATLEVDVRPAWPHRLPLRGSPDGIVRVRRGVLARLLQVDGAPIVVHAWQLWDGTVMLRATSSARSTPRQMLEVAIERMRFALGVDDDLSEF